MPYGSSRIRVRPEGANGAATLIGSVPVAIRLAATPTSRSGAPSRSRSPRSSSASSSARRRIASATAAARTWSRASSRSRSGASARSPSRSATVERSVRPRSANTPSQRRRRSTGSAGTVAAPGTSKLTAARSGDTSVSRPPSAVISAIRTGPPSHAARRPAARSASPAFATTRSGVPVKPAAVINVASSASTAPPLGCESAPSRRAPPSRRMSAPLRSPVPSTMRRSGSFTGHSRLTRRAQRGVHHACTRGPADL